jgi:hypothetical protein
MADEGLLPQLAPLVAPALHELLELPVRHLGAVEPELRQVHFGGALVLEAAAGNEHHPGRGLVLGDEP